MAFSPLPLRIVCSSESKQNIGYVHLASGKRLNLRWGASYFVLVYLYLLAKSPAWSDLVLRAGFGFLVTGKTEAKCACMVKRIFR